MCAIKDRLRECTARQTIFWKHFRLNGKCHRRQCRSFRKRFGSSFPVDDVSEPSELEKLYSQEVSRRNRSVSLSLSCSLGNFEQPGRSSALVNSLVRHSNTEMHPAPFLLLFSFFGLGNFSLRFDVHRLSGATEAPHFWSAPSRIMRWVFEGAS